MILNRKYLILFLALFILGTILRVSAQVDTYPSGYATASIYAVPADEKLIASSGLRGGFNLDGYLINAPFRLSLELNSNLAGIPDAADHTGDWYYPGAWESRWNDRTSFSADLKEAWVGFMLGDFDLTVGKQILTWGQADGTNPTDNINPQYIGTRSVSGSTEKKMGVPMVNLVYYLPGTSATIQGVFMPIASYNQMPSLSEYISVEIPEPSFDNMEGGLRAFFYPGAVSISISYLNILDRYPSDAVETVLIPPTFTTLVPSVLGHSRQQIFGFDAAWLVNGFDFRTEWALTLTGDSEGSDPFAQNRFLSGVLQGSRSVLNGTTNISLSWAPKYIFDFEKPEVPPSAPYLSQLYLGQGFEWENIVGLRVQSKILNETFQPEVMFLTALSARDYLATTGFTYNLADGWNLKAGANFFGSFRSDSDQDRNFGVFGNDYAIDSDTVYVEVRYDF
jgi:hypothetical protein